MTLFVTTAATDGYARLWRHAVHDTGMAVSFVRPGSSGHLFGDTVADLLVGSGRAQPCLLEAPREVTRADLGRLQVGLARSGRDVVVMHAERLAPGDARLLELCTTRAGVDAFLIGEGLAPVRTAGDTPGTVLDPEELLDVWSRRSTASQRGERWSCHAALGLDSGMAPSCGQHADALDCVLAWFPHAVATARASSPAVRTRLYQLSRTSPDAAMRIWPHARDIHYGAHLVAVAMDLPAPVVRAVTLNDLASDGSAVTWHGQVLEVPDRGREVMTIARDDKLADGFGMEVCLFGVRTASVKRFRAARTSGRTGDRVPLSHC